MKNITTWRPDTCGCEIQYEWDADSEAETRIHTIVSVTHCYEHSTHNFSVGDAIESHPAHVKNIHKNKSISAVVDHLKIEKASSVGWKYQDGILHLILPSEHKGKDVPGLTDVVIE